MNQLEQDLAAPLVGNELEDIAQYLKNTGFEPKTVGAALQCDLTLRGQRCGHLHFYPAERLLALQAVSEEERSAALRALWDALFSEEWFSTTPRVDQYLYALGSGETLNALAVSGLLATLESDQAYARKTARMPHELRTFLGSLYACPTEEFRTHEKPSVRLLRELRDDPAAVAAVTRWLTPAKSFEDETPPSEMQRLRMEQLYERIMGRGFTLLWENDQYSAMNGCSGVFPQHASRGEQAGYALARFLSRVAASPVSPGMTLGVQGLLHSLDALKQLAALDELRYFMASFGVSFVIQTANTRVLELAEMKLRQLADVKRGDKRL